MKLPKLLDLSNSLSTQNRRCIAFHRTLDDLNLCDGIDAKDFGDLQRSPFLQAKDKYRCAAFLSLILVGRLRTWRIAYVAAPSDNGYYNPPPSDVNFLH
jgi:hypothetical protein